MDDILKKLKLIQEGAILEDADEDIDDEELDEELEELDDEILSEVNRAIIEDEIGEENMEEFISENASELIRDGILTENVVGKSYIVLSPQARRQKAINILKLRMARNAGDPRYKKLVIARKLVKSLLEKIRNDGRYKKAETIIRKQRFKVVNNPQAAAAMKKAKSLKLQ